MQGGSPIWIYSAYRICLIVLLVVMVLFGTNRLPEIGAGLGKAIRNFKQASSELDEVDATFKKDEKDITK